MSSLVYGMSARSSLCFFWRYVTVYGDNERCDGFLLRWERDHHFVCSTPFPLSLQYNTSINLVMVTMKWAGNISNSLSYHLLQKTSQRQINVNISQRQRQPPIFSRLEARRMRGCSAHARTTNARIWVHRWSVPLQPLSVLGQVSTVGG